MEEGGGGSKTERTRYAPNTDPESGSADTTTCAEREFFIDNLLVRIHVISKMIWWTGLAP